MNVIGQPPPIAVVPNTESSQLAFRINQRVTAEVLQIATDHVMLSIQGVQVVARLTTPDQYAALADYRTAHFVVRDLSNQTLTLQLTEVTGRTVQPATPTPPELISNLLKLADLPVNDTTIQLARALLNNGLPVTPRNMMEMFNTLAHWQNSTFPQSKLNLPQGLPTAQAEMLLPDGSTQNLAEGALAANMAANAQATLPDEQVAGANPQAQPAAQPADGDALEAQAAVNDPKAQSAGNTRTQTSPQAVQTDPEAQAAEMLKNLLQTTTGKVLWGPNEANTTATLKAAGLPVTAGSLSLALTDLPPLAQEISRLQSQFQNLLAQAKSSPRLAELTQNALDVINNLITKWDAPPDAIQENLRQAISVLGRSLESRFSDLEKNGITSLGKLPPEPNLLGLAQLRHEIAQLNPKNPLVQDIDRFIDNLRMIQFANTEPNIIPAKGQWLSMDLPLQVSLPPNPAAARPEAELHAARLRIDYPSDGQSHKIDPSYTSIVIQVDLDPGETLEVNLSLVHKQAGAHIVTTTEDLRNLADSEIPNLQAGLAKIGFDLKSASCRLASHEPEPQQELLAPNLPSPGEINITT